MQPRESYESVLFRNYVALESERERLAEPEKPQGVYPVRQDICTICHSKLQSESCPRSPKLAWVNGIYFPSVNECDKIGITSCGSGKLLYVVCEGCIKLPYIDLLGLIFQDILDDLEAWVRWRRE